MVNGLDAFAGLLVGTVVGLTGVGGGALMSPILILLFGVAPATAVGTDLFFAAITKTAGSIVHHRQQSADLGIVGWLCIGSIPAAILTLAMMAHHHGHQIRNGLIVEVLGVTLILTSVATLVRKRLLSLLTARIALAWKPSSRRWQIALTIAAGALLGVLVTLTSVGAGALGATILTALYPLRLTVKRLVGTDIMHAVPLTATAGIGYLLAGSVDITLLGSLLIGSLPGIVIGSRLAAVAPDVHVQRLLALVLFATGFRLLAV